MKPLATPVLGGVVSSTVSAECDSHGLHLAARKRTVAKGDSTRSVRLRRQAAQLGFQVIPYRTGDVPRESAWRQRSARMLAHPWTTRTDRAQKIRNKGALTEWCWFPQSTSPKRNAACARHSNPSWQAVSSLVFVSQSARYI